MNPADLGLISPYTDPTTTTCYAARLYARQFVLFDNPGTHEWVTEKAASMTAPAFWAAHLGHTVTGQRSLVTGDDMWTCADCGMSATRRGAVIKGEAVTVPCPVPLRLVA